MSDYKPKKDISEALAIMDSMLTVRRKDTRVKSADAIETVLYDYYRKSEKLDKIEQIVMKSPDEFKQCGLKELKQILEVLVYE